MGVAYVVFCSTCKAVGKQSELNLKSLRAQLKAQGWSVNQSGGFDYCPSHWPGRTKPNSANVNNRER